MPPRRKKSWVPRFVWGETRREHAYANVIREAASWIAEREEEDAHWQKLSATGADQQAGPLPRAQMIAWARWAFAGGDPFIQQGIGLLTKFCFGNGMDGPQGDSTEIAPLLDFWQHRDNKRALFGIRAQYEASNALLIDGDLFLAVYPDDTPVQVRVFPTLNVQRIITDPDDSTRPLYYATRYLKQIFNKELGMLVADGNWAWRYYRDINNDDPNKDPLANEIDSDGKMVLYHVPLNRAPGSSYGSSGAAGAYRWTNYARDICRDQATLSKVTAALALMAKVSGDTTSVERIMTDLESLSDDEELPVAGDLNFQQGEWELKVDRPPFGSKDAWVNDRIMRIRVVAALGLSLHYLGDPENANLATSTSMEAPQQKHFESYQALWLEIFSDLLNFAGEKAGMSKVDEAYKIPVPRLLEPNVAAYGKQILDSLDMNLLTDEQAAQRNFELLGFDDIPEQMRLWREDAEAREEEEPAAQMLVAPMPPPEAVPTVEEVSKW